MQDMGCYIWDARRIAGYECRMLDPAGSACRMWEVKCSIRD